MDEVKEKTININASDVEACRTCLATNVKLHSLQETHLGTCMESIGGFDKSFEGLPNYVCYECAPVLLKYKKLLEKSKIAQTTLLDILNKNGQISKPLIEEQKKSETNLQSSLNSYLLLNYFYIQYDDDSHTSDFIKIESDPDKKINIKLKSETDEKSGDEGEVSDSEILKMIKLLSNEEEMDKDLSKEEESPSDSDVETIEVPVPVVEIESDDDKMGDDFISLKTYNVKMDNPVKGLLAKDDDVPLYNVKKKMRPIGLAKERGRGGRKKLKKSRLRDAPTPNPIQDEDIFVRRYFNIKVINKAERPTSKQYFCKHCPEKYNYVNDARDHVIIGCQRSSSKNNKPTSVQLEPAAYAMSSQPTVWEEWPGGSK